MNALMEGIASGITDGVSGGMSSSIINMVKGKESFDADKAKSDMDKMFPGTSSWERLGGSGSSAVAGADSAANVAKIQTRSNERVASIKAAAERYSVDRQAKTAETVANISSEPGSRQASIAEQKLSQELNVLSAQEKQILEDVALKSISYVEKELMNKGIPLDNRMKRVQAVLKEAEEKFASQYASLKASSGNLFQWVDQELANTEATMKDSSNEGFGSTIINHIKSIRSSIANMFNN